MSEAVSDALDTVTKQFDRRLEEVQIHVGKDVTADEFYQRVMPYAIGYCGSTHGLTGMSALNRTLTFEKIEQ